MTSSLERVVSDHYGVDEYAVTRRQSDIWADSQPLAGVRILDCTPLFRNTLAKFIPLVAAGAELTVGVHPDIPSDPAIVSLIPHLGLELYADPVVGTDRESATHDSFDVVMDCAGRHRHVASTFGYIELTHSGLAEYQTCAQPVITVDHSPIKLMETMFGTGESFLRALAQLGHQPSGGPVVVFGGGKVGSGIAYGALQSGLDAIIIDDPATAANYAGARVVDRRDRDAVSSAIARAWTIVTATGVANAAAPYARQIAASSAIVANMGVDDEFGSEVPNERVLNDKRPVNFILEEPTLMRYMDPIFALSNNSALSLIRGESPAGVHPPTADAQQSVASVMRDTRNYTNELNLIANLTTSA